MFKKIIILSLLLIFLLTSNVFALTKEEVEPYIGKIVDVVYMVNFMGVKIPIGATTQLLKVKVSEEGVEIGYFVDDNGNSIPVPLFKIVFITDGETEVGEIPE